MHLLSTLRMTALKSGKKGSRYLRGTPHPRDRRARSVTPGIEEEDSATELDGSARLLAPGDDMTAISGTSTISEGLSNDLTTLPRGNGNTSLPLAGPGSAAEGGIVGASRFNNAKLNNYLHTLNTHLTTENQNLIKTLEETAKEVTRLMRKNEELSRMNGSEEMSAGHHAASSMSRIAQDEEGNGTREMLQSHRKTSQDISTLREHLTGNRHSKQVEDMAEKMKEKDARLARLEADLEQRNAEIATMREDVLKRSRSEAGVDESAARAEVDLHQQIFTLRDELAQVKAENTLQINDLAKLRSEQVEQASRHNKATADLQNRTEELLLELEEKDAIIEEVENELVRQEDDFRAKMTNLEEELCKVMEEQEVQLREARKEIQTLKEAGAKSANGPDEDIHQLQSKIEMLEREMEALQATNEKTEKLLQEATATIASSESAGADGNKSADDINSDKLAFLQRRVEEQESRIAQKEEELQNLRTQLSEAKKAFEADLKTLQHEASNAQDAKAQTERKLSSQAVMLKETEKAFADSEDNLRQTAEELNEARKQLQAVQEEISSLKNEQLEAMSSDLQKKYDAAVREIGNLKHQLAYPPAQTSDAQLGKYSKHDSRDLEIKTLRSSNHELETRVNQLRKQAMLAGPSSSNRSVSSMNTPNQTEKSVRFDSVQSMKTPRSATQLLGVCTSSYLEHFAY